MTRRRTTANHTDRPAPQHSRALEEQCAAISAQAPPPAVTDPLPVTAPAAPTVAEQIAQLRTHDECQHGDPGGDQKHPTTAEPLCPLCRRMLRPAPDLHPTTTTAQAETAPPDKLARRRAAAGRARARRMGLTA